MEILTFEQNWELFKSMAVEELCKAGYKDDPWDMAESVDYSFEHEYLPISIETWRDKIISDIAAFKEDCPEDFE